MLTTDQGATVGGDLLASSNLAVHGSTHLTGLLTTDRDATVGGDLTVLGATTLASNVTVAGFTHLTGLLTTDQGANIGGDLHVSSNLAVSGGAYLLGQLDVAGPVTLNSNVTAQQGLSVSGPTTLLSNLSVAGDITSTGTIYAKSLQLSEPLIFPGSADVLRQSNAVNTYFGNTAQSNYGRMTFTGPGDVVFDQPVHFSNLQLDNITTTTTTTSNLIVHGGGVFVFGSDAGQSVDDLITGETSVTTYDESVAIASNLVVNGKIICRGLSFSVCNWLDPNSNVTFKGDVDFQQPVTIKDLAVDTLSTVSNLVIKGGGLIVLGDSGNADQGLAGLLDVDQPATVHEDSLAVSKDLIVAGRILCRGLLFSTCNSPAFDEIGFTSSSSDQQRAWTARVSSTSSSLIFESQLGTRLQLTDAPCSPLSQTTTICHLDPSEEAALQELLIHNNSPPSLLLGRIVFANNASLQAPIEVCLTRQARDARVLGVVSAVYPTGSAVTHAALNMRVEEGVVGTRTRVAVVTSGLVDVGLAPQVLDVQNGDLLTSCDGAVGGLGLADKDGGDLVRSCTVGKAVASRSAADAVERPVLVCDGARLAVRRAMVVHVPCLLI
jgi:hypothetical protein